QDGDQPGRQKGDTEVVAGAQGVAQIAHRQDIKPDDAGSERAVHQRAVDDEIDVVQPILEHRDPDRAGDTGDGHGERSGPYPCRAEREDEPEDRAAEHQDGSAHRGAGDHLSCWRSSPRERRYRSTSDAAAASSVANKTAKASVLVARRAGPSAPTPNG